jgi:hypothetical protein
MPLEELCLFGFASLPVDGTGFVFKLMGRDVPGDAYQLVFLATNVTQSFAFKFSLADVCEALEDEFGAKPSEQSMLDILKQRFDCEELEARLAPSSTSSAAGGSRSSSGAAADGLQVVAEHSTGDSEDDIKFTVRLPPRHGAPRKSGAWVAQDILFTANDRLRGVQQRLDTCEQRCPASQQFDDALAFLALADGSEPEAPRAAVHKRKEPEAPVSASAVKAARPSGEGQQAAQPAATQQTGSTQQTQRTNASAAVEARVQRVSGHGRGRGLPAGRGRGRGRR